MKKLVRSSAILACTIIGFSLTFSNTVRADDGDMLRMSQTRLAELGYFPGREDGIMGSQTTTAVRDFQTYVGLPITGFLDIDTFNMLMKTDSRLYPNGGVTQVAYTMPQYIAPAAPVTAAPVVYYGNSYPQYAAPVTTPVTYTTNGYGQYIAAPAVMPVAYSYGSYGYVDIGSRD